MPSTKEKSIVRARVLNRGGAGEPSGEPAPAPGMLDQLYGASVGRDLISDVTDAVMDDVRAWPSRPLEDVYPLVCLDCLVLKIRDGGSVVRKACYLAMAIGPGPETSTSIRTCSTDTSSRRRDRRWRRIINAPAAA